jgi:hypothetical protein
MPVVAWLTFAAAAVLEVAGDAVIRTGLRGSGTGPDWRGLPDAGAHSPW